MGKKYILVLFFLVFQQVMAQEKILNLYLNSNSEVVSFPICYIDSICVTTASTLDNTIVFSGLPIINLKVEEKIENPVPGCLTVEKEINTIGGGFLWQAFGNMIIQGHGNTTWAASEKKPYKVKFSKKQPLLGLPKQKSWIFFSNPLDSSMLRNEVGFILSRLSNLEWTPHSAYADVYLNDNYRGTYQISEKIGISNTRLNLGDDGFLLETVPSNRVSSKEVYVSTKCLNLQVKEPELSPENVEENEDYCFIKDYVLRCEEAIYSVTDCADDGTPLTELIDIDSYVDWFLINEITKNVDARMFASCYMHMKRNGKLTMGPVWDFDLSLGNCLPDHPDELRHPENLYIATAAWISRLLSKPFFMDKVKQRYAFFYANKQKIIDSIRENAKLIERSSTKNAERWNFLRSPKDYEEEMIEFLSKRMDWLYQEWFGNANI